MLKVKTVWEIISSKLTKPSGKSNLQPESLPPSPISVKSLLSVLNSMGKELSINLVNILDVLQVHQLDGYQVPSPTKSPKNSNNLDCSLWQIPSPTVKQSLRPPTSTSPPSLSATLMPH
jgi:hypothetical protein